MLNKYNIFELKEYKIDLICLKYIKIKVKMASVRILIVEKTGAIKELNWKKFDEEEIYKKANLKKKDNFKLHTTYNTTVKNKKYKIDVYGKENGRANMENKYEFPPPIDNTLFFGCCVLINRDSENNPIDITSEEWEKVYEVLYGGFEDINSEDSEEEEEEEEVNLTKSGYAKDGFVVEDEDDYLDCSSELSDDDYI